MPLRRLVKRPNHLLDRVGTGHNGEVDTGRAGLDPFFGLTEGPVPPDFLHVLRVGGLHLCGEVSRNLGVEVLRYELKVPLLQNLDARDNGHFDAHVPALLDEFEEVVVVEEHLRDDVVAPCLYLLLQAHGVPRQVWRLEIGFKASGYSSTPMQKSVDWASFRSSRYVPWFMSST